MWISAELISLFDYIKFSKQTGLQSLALDWKMILKEQYAKSFPIRFVTIFLIIRSANLEMV